MPNFNKTIMVGHLTRDPELRHAQSGTAIVKCGIASNYKRGDHENTCFIDFTVFGKSAEVFEKHLNKGDAVILEGRLEYQTWESEGGKRSKHELVVNEWHFAGSKGGAKADEAPVSEAVPF